VSMLHVIYIYDTYVCTYTGATSGGGGHTWQPATRVSTLAPRNPDIVCSCVRARTCRSRNSWETLEHIYPSIYLYLYLYQSINVSTCLSIFLSIYILSIYIFVGLSIFLSIYPFTASEAFHFSSLDFLVLGVGFPSSISVHRDLIRTSIYDTYSGSMKLLHSWIISFIVQHRLVKIG